MSGWTWLTSVRNSSKRFSSGVPLINSACCERARQARTARVRSASGFLT